MRYTVVILFHTAEGSAENRQQFEEAMKHGHVKAELGKMLIYGAAGSGKTSFKELFVGNPPPSSRESTSLAVRPTTMYRVHVEGKEWATLTTLKERREFLAKASIKCNPSDKAQPIETSTNTNRESTTTTSGRRWGRALILVLLFFLLLLFGFYACMYTGCYLWHYLCWLLLTCCSLWFICQKYKVQPQVDVDVEITEQLDLKNPNTDKDKLTFSTATDNRLIQAMDQLSSRVDKQPLASFRMLQIIDSGGQPQFHEILPIFLHQLSFYVFVFRLCDDLTSRPEVEFYANDKSIGVKYTSALTIEQLLQHCARTIQSQGSSKEVQPQIMIIGTHVDQEDNSNENRSIKNDRILKLLLHTVKNQITYSNMTSKKVIFPFNTKIPGQEEHHMIEQIRKALLSEASLPVADIPLKWYALEILFEEMAIALQQGVLSKQQCFRAAVEKLHFNANASDSEFEAALEYLSKLSVLFYYPRVLPNVIFANPQAILDKVTELVVTSFQMSENSETQVLTEEWCRFHEFALVTTDLLSKEEFNKHYVSGLFEAKDLVDLFIKLLIFARFSKTELFVPALLRNLDRKEINEYRTFSGPALVLQFPYGGPRQGLFCSLLCWLASPEYNSPAPWSILTDEIGVPVCLYRNCVNFEFPNSPATITLIDTYTHFEVHVHVPKHCSHDFCPKLYPTIKRQVFKGLHKAMENLHYNSCTPIPAFLCPCGSEEAHVATINAELSYWICSVCKEKCEKLSQDQLLWLKEQQVSHDFNDTKELKEEHLPDLLTALQNHASKWRDIGTYLGFQQGELDNIAANQLLQPNSPHSFLTAMLTKWLQWAPGDIRESTSFATLEMLKSALTKSGLGATGQQLSLKKLQ